jgi:HlyD family secretion protein
MTSESNRTTIRHQSDNNRHEVAILGTTRRRLMTGYAVSAFIAFGIVGYAANAEIRGAVITQGSMVVEGNLRKIQHQDGGTVHAIHVRSGQRVSTGELLLKLEDTQRRAEFSQVVSQLTSHELRAARLEAERDNLAAIVFPASVKSRLGEVEVLALADAETTLFDARRRSRRGEEAQLRERAAQTREEIVGLEAQRRSVMEQASITKQELDDLQGLQRQGLTQVSRVNPLRRSFVQLEGQAGELTAQIARARGRISEIELQITQIEKQVLNEATRDLRETKDKIADLLERRTTTEEKLRRTEIRAPIDGVVHQLSVFTIGGVIAPGEAIMQLVPEGEKLLVESRIEPSFIDQVVLGQPAVVRLSSLDSRTTPELAGKVTFISADIEQDQRPPGASFFRARVELNVGEAERLEGQKLIPGLPAEIHIQTKERTILSFFMRPFTDQIARAFRER